jgi:uncharacterized membrane protein required for colicin V production
MFVDAIAVGVLALFVTLGIIQGTVATALRLLTLIGAYAIALGFAASAAGPVGEITSLPPFLHIPAAGAFLFVASFVVLGVLTKVLTVVERRWRGDHPRTGFDRAGGATVGLLRGALIVLLIGVLGQWIEAGRVAGQLESVPDGGASQVVDLTKSVVETGSRAALGEENVGGRMAVRLLSDPAEVVEGMMGLVNNPRITGLQEDRLFWSYVANGAYDAALNQGSFLGITYDETLRHELADLGVIEPGAAEDPRLFRTASREILVEIGPRLKRLQDDPVLHKLAEDPEIQSALASGDTLTLLQNAEFQALIGRVMSGPETN